MQDFFEKPGLGERLEDVLKETRKWGRLTANSLRFRVASLTLSERVAIETALQESIRSKVKAPKLEVEQVAFVFPRHGIFIEHGVGRGRPVGSSKANKHKKPWLKPILDDTIIDLVDILSEQYANVAAAELRILIPGIFDTKIKLNG